MFSALEISRNHSLSIQVSALGKCICKASWNCFADCCGVYPVLRACLSNVRIRNTGKRPFPSHILSSKGWEISQGQANNEPLQSLDTMGSSVPSAKHFLAKANWESSLVISCFDLAVVPHHEAGNVLASSWHLSSLANLLKLTSVLICCFVVFSLSTHLVPPCTSFKGLKDAAQSERSGWPLTANVILAAPCKWLFPCLQRGFGTFLSKRAG